MSDKKDFLEDDEYLETQEHQPEGATGSERDTGPVHPLPSSAEAYKEFDKSALRDPEPPEDEKPTEQVRDEESDG